jgi:hypothetical protein
MIKSGSQRFALRINNGEGLAGRNERIDTSHLRKLSATFGDWQLILHDLPPHNADTIREVSREERMMQMSTRCRPAEPSQNRYDKRQCATPILRRDASK